MRSAALVLALFGPTLLAGCCCGTRGTWESVNGPIGTTPAPQAPPAARKPQRPVEPDLPPPTNLYNPAPEQLPQVTLPQEAPPLTGTPAAPDEPWRCTAITEEGHRCHRSARSAGVCWQHGG